MASTCQPVISDCFLLSYSANSSCMWWGHLLACLHVFALCRCTSDWSCHNATQNTIILCYCNAIIPQLLACVAPLQSSSRGKTPVVELTDLIVWGGRRKFRCRYKSSKIRPAAARQSDIKTSCRTCASPCCVCVCTAIKKNNPRTNFFTFICSDGCHSGPLCR